MEINQNLETLWDILAHHELSTKERRGVQAVCAYLRYTLDEQVSQLTFLHSMAGMLC